MLSFHTSFPDGSVLEGFAVPIFDLFMATKDRVRANHLKHWVPL